MLYKRKHNRMRMTMTNDFKILIMRLGFLHLLLMKKMTRKLIKFMKPLIRKWTRGGKLEGLLDLFQSKNLNSIEFSFDILLLLIEKLVKEKSLKNIVQKDPKFSSNLPI